jgi:hypothetical protein
MSTHEDYATAWSALSQVKAGDYRAGSSRVFAFEGSPRPTG